MLLSQNISLVIELEVVLTNLKTISVEEKFIASGNILKRLQILVLEKLLNSDIQQECRKGEGFNNMIHTHSKSEYGILWVNISKTVQPRLQMSAASPYPWFFRLTTYNTMYGYQLNVKSLPKIASFEPNMQINKQSHRLWSSGPVKRFEYQPYKKSSC